MDKAAYTNLLKFTKSLSAQNHPCPGEFSKYAGVFFSEDDACRLFARIVTERAKESQLVSPVNDKQRETAIQKSKMQVRTLTGRQKFCLFVLYFLYCADPHNWKPIRQLEWHLKFAADVLGISDSELSDMRLFYSQTIPYVDKQQAVYLAPQTCDPLIRASALNIHFSLNDTNEVIYLKYFRARNVFLSRRFQLRKAHNSIGHDINIKEINIVDNENCSDLFGKDVVFENLASSVISFFPLQTVRSRAGENIPAIYMDAVLGRVTISGNSSPLSPLNYFQPVYDWMNLYDELGGEHLEVHLHFNYFNSYTSKFILNFTNMCIQLVRHGKSVDFSWHYNADDDESFEFGEHLARAGGKVLAVKLIKDNTAILV